MRINGEFFTLPKSFLSTLDEHKKIRNQLQKEIEISQGESAKNNKKEKKEDLRSEIMPAVRRLRHKAEISWPQKKPNVFLWQRKAIKLAFKQWMQDCLIETGHEERKMGDLDKWFKEFYGNVDGINDADPILHYERASNFLFALQNIAIFCPEAVEVYLFSYAALNGKQQSSLTFFFNSSTNLLDLSACGKIFSLLIDIESAAPCLSGQVSPVTQNYKLWSSSFNRLQEKRKGNDKSTSGEGQ